MDYIVSVESDVFVPSFSGNRACAVEDDRQFLGHHKTISPDRYGGAACTSLVNVHREYSITDLLISMHKSIGFYQSCYKCF